MSLRQTFAIFLSFFVLCFVGSFYRVQAQESLAISATRHAWELHELPTYKIASDSERNWTTQLINQETGASIDHQVLYDTHTKNGVVLMYVDPNTLPTTGTYVFSVAQTAGETPFFTDTFNWTDANSASGTYTISRSHLPTILKPDTTYHQTLTVHAQKPVSGSLVEKIPFDFVPTATDASIIKRPELLNLQKPFDGDFPVSLEFGHVNPVGHFGMPYHDGTDYAVPTGTTIRAVDDGEVIPYREVNTYGITVAIQHAWGRSYYGHLSSSSAVLGTHVKKGDALGYSGSTGLSTGPHLHFAMVWGDEQFIDPDPHVTRISPQPTSQKELVWPLKMAAGDTKVIEYSFVIPDPDDATIATNTLGPASIVDQQKPCRPPFVSQALLTHYEKNDELPTGDQADQDILVCPISEKETAFTTILSSSQFGQSETAHPAAQNKPHKEDAASNPPEASNILKNNPSPLPAYPTTYLDNATFWYNPTSRSIEGVDSVNSESFSQFVGSTHVVDLKLDTEVYRVTVLKDNTLALTRKVANISL